ncbi:hypothetical protein [Gilvimarinus algae]|uniref:Uncharacterized protein n=1 Tax=Gilvimarinus algae TaxID=3058037 RepID=A0ABT8TC42_9GAMM|nr:hypothetical protein [Gilvimarinus sp. SDUM040014]MDO3380948.1 hypothetical protein [Gilvimarinus sp. SDUM040014]
MMFNRKSPQAASEAIQHAGSSAAVAPLDVVPASGIRDKRVTDIPTSLVSSHADWKPAGNWTGVFDLAVWLRLPKGCSHPLQLALRFTDQRGENTVLVDICKPGAFKSALLNGSVQVNVSGRVKEMGLYLLSLPSDLPVGLEEWHFLPQIKRH